MDDFQGEKNIKKELAIDSTTAGVKITDASGILDVSQTIQQLLAMSSIAGGAILSPMQLLQASASSGASTSQLSLPWIVPHHYQQMMVLQQGLAQPFLMSDVDDKDGHVVVMPTGDQANHYSNISVISSPSDLQVAQVGGQGVQSVVGLTDLSSSGQLRNHQLNTAQKPKESAGATQLSSSGDRTSPKRGAVHHAQLHSDSARTLRPRPPKKPLTPYMLFSKEMWHRVKAANSHLSLVTEIGAIIGSMWRELDAKKKEHYNELFSRDKIRYDEEIRVYLKNNNMHPSDLIRARLSKKKDSKALNTHRPQVAAHSSTILNPPGQQLVQSLLGYPVVDGSQAIISLDGTGPSNLMQTWAGQPIQQILAHMGLTGHLTQATANELQVNDGGATGQQQQQLALQIHAMLSNASICGNSSDELVQSSATRSYDCSSTVNHLSAESAAVSTADKSKLWSWPSAQILNSSSSSSIQGNYNRNTDHGPLGAAAMTDQPMDEGQSSETTDDKTTAVVCGSVGDWSEGKCEGHAPKSQEVEQLESRVLFLESSLSEKNKEIEKLVDQLEKAHQIIADFTVQPDIVEEKAVNCGANGAVSNEAEAQQQQQQHQ